MVWEGRSALIHVGRRVEVGCERLWGDNGDVVLAKEVQCTVIEDSLDSASVEVWSSVATASRRY